MTPHAPGTAAPSTAAGPVVLPGTPVVPGVAWGPVVRPSGAVALPGDDGVVVREEERAGEKERFTAAAGVVADRLNARAGAATGVSAEVLANALAPADTAGLDPRRITGLATRLGGTTSHTAIIARQLGLPCVVAVGGLDAVPEGATVLLDGERGTVTVDPDPAPARGLRPPPTRRVSGCSAPSWRSSAGPRSPRWRSRQAVTRRCSRPSPVSGSSSARWTPGPTSRWPSPRCRTRRTRLSASVACGSPAGTPACWTGSSTRSPRPPDGPAPR